MIRIGSLALFAVIFSGCFSSMETDSHSYQPIPDRLLSPGAQGVVHVFHAANRAPGEKAMEALKGAFGELGNFAAFEIEAPQPIPDLEDDSEKVWTLDEVIRLGQRLLPHELRQEPVVHLAIYYLNGEMEAYPDGTVVGGFALSQEIVIFPDYYPMFSVGGEGPSNPDLESVMRRVTMHEFGHILGLVNHGLPMLQSRVALKDPCGCHSKYDESVMYYGIHDAGDLLQYALDDPALLDPNRSDFQFDVYDWQDIRAHQATLRAQTLE